MTATIEIAARGYAAAEVRPKSVNAGARTVEIIFSTGAPVKRYSWDEGYYMEVLEMSPASVDLGRLNAGASLLDTHAQGTMANRIGAVVPGSARIENGKGVCVVQLSTARNGQQLLDDLAQGLPLPISVGYRVHEYSKTEGDENALPTYTATRWEPLEVSAVPVPADAGAHARADAPQAQRNTVPVIARRAEDAAGIKEFEMTTTLDADPALAERKRAADITQIGNAHRASTRLIKKAVDTGVSVAEFREMVMDEMRAYQARTETFGITPPHDADVGQRRLGDRLADALMARVKPGSKVENDTRQFVGLSAAELARAALHELGQSTTGVRPSELIGRALHTTSDFGYALSAVAGRLVAAGYENAPSQIKRIARETSAKDFRAKTSIRLTEAGGLEKVNEHGEFKRGKWAEGSEAYAIDTYGKIFGLTRQALINDDLDLLQTVPNRLGEYASRFESAFLSNLLETPPRMQDGQPLFHASHGNLAATGAAISISSLGVARLALRRQRGIGGEVIAVEPKFLVVPPELETLAEQVLAEVNASKVEDVNPFAGRLELVVEPHLKSDRAWYLAASQTQTGFEYAYLEGESGPQIETRVGFDIDGTEWKVRLDFGGGFTDTRGIYKNPGVAE